jgi:hypothetical protein
MYGKHTDLSDDRASAGAKRGKVGMLLRWHKSGSGTKRRLAQCGLTSAVGGCTGNGRATVKLALLTQTGHRTDFAAPIRIFHNGACGLPQRRYGEQSRKPQDMMPGVVESADEPMFDSNARPLQSIGVGDLAIRWYDDILGIG